MGGGQPDGGAEGALDLGQAPGASLASGTRTKHRAGGDGDVTGPTSLCDVPFLTAGGWVRADDLISIAIQVKGSQRDSCPSLVPEEFGLSRVFAFYSTVFAVGGR